MIVLAPTLARIEALLAEDTDASVTYAALEARLAIERVCYDRLRQCHDYIAHDQLRRWQPHQVMAALVREVDERAQATVTLSMSKTPVDDTIPLDQHEYQVIGTQIGFDAKAIEKLWQALSGLALHARMPKARDDSLPDYGDRAAIRSKVIEARVELERISATTMTMSGFGPEVSFQCDCGQTNKRRAALLREGQSVFCINPECAGSYTYQRSGEDHDFVPEQVEMACDQCGAPVYAARRLFLKMDRETIKPVICPGCGHANEVQWILAQRRDPKPLASD